MTLRNSGRNLDVLPNLFYTQDSVVDHKFITDIWKKHRKTRDLKALVGSAKGSTEDERFKELADRMEDPAFREKWYDDVTARRKNSVTAFYHQAMHYVEIFDPNLSWDSPELSGFFSRIDGKRYPQLNKIDGFIQAVISSSADVRIIALFLWSLAEACKHSSLYQPKNTSLKGFRIAVEERLKVLRQDSLLELLKFGPWRLQTNRAASSLQANFVKVASNSNPVEHWSRPLLTDIQNNQKRISERVQLSYYTKVEQLRTLATNLRSSSSPVDDLSEISEVKNQLDELVREITDEATSLSTSIDQLLIKVSDGWILDIVKDENSSLFPEIKNWNENIDDYCQKLQRVAQDISLIKDYCNGNLAFVRKPISQISFDQAVNQIRIIRDEVREAGEIQRRYQAALAKCNEKARDLCWNAVEDESLTANDWASLLAMANRDSPWSLYTALLVKKTFDNSFDSFGTHCLNALSDIDNLPAVINSISILDQAQIEKLVSEHGNLELYSALAQLQTFLYSQEKAVGQPLECWSDWPLSKYAKSVDDFSGPTEKFFTSIFQQAAELKIQHPIAELRNALEALNESSSISDDHFISSKRKELSEILKFRSHGGGTYGAIWKIAYSDVFGPLNEKIYELPIHEYLQFVQQTLAKIIVEDRYETWIRNFPSHVQNESHYEKVTRSYVLARISELDAWCSRTEDEILERSLPNKVVYSIVSTVAQSSIPDAKIIFRWLTSFVSKFDTEAISHSNSLDDLTNACFGNPPSLMLARSTLAFLKGQTVSWEILLTDEVSLRSACFSAQDCIEIYRSASNIEAMEKVSLEYRAEIPSKEFSQISRAVELESTKAAIKMSDLRSKVREFDITEMEGALIHELESYLLNKQWTKFESNLVLLEAAIEDLQKRLQDAEEKTRLRTEIHSLGFFTTGNESAEDLERILQTAIESSHTRRRHIAVISEFINTPNLDSNIVSHAEAAQLHLSASQNLPSQAESELLAEAYRMVFQSLAEQLKRPATLLKTYCDALESIATWALKSLRSGSAGTHIDSLVITSFLDVGHRLRFASTMDDIQKLLKDIGEIHGDIGYETADEIESDLQVLAISSGAELSIFSENSDIEDELDENELSAWLTAQRSKTSRNSTREQLYLAVKGNSWQTGFRVGCELLASDEFGDSTSVRNDILATTALCFLAAPNVIAPVRIYVLALTCVDRSKDSNGVRVALTSKSATRLYHEVFINVFGLLLSDNDSAASGADIKRDLSLLIRDLSASSLNFLTLESIASVVAALQKYDAYKKGNSPLIKGLWEIFSGDKAQAEIRGSLLLVFWKLQMFRCLTECLSYAPIEIEPRVAEGLSKILKSAGSGGALDSIENLRHASQAKPYSVFAERVLLDFTRNAGAPVRLRWIAPLEKTREKLQWRGVLEIEPRLVNPPLDIELEFSKASKVTGQNGATKLRIEGPFFETTQRELVLSINLSEMHHINIESTCKVQTLDGQIVQFKANLDTLAAGSEPFEALGPEIIEHAFSSFPSRHMRGKEFVARPEDETKIENVLFKGTDSGSLWLASPRRSGKTSMLFRLLDSYSHASGKDNAVLFFTFDTHFSTLEDFNTFIWRRLRSSKENSDFRDRIPDFDRVGENLQFDAGVSDFLYKLCDELMSRAKWISRIYFLFDEVDRLAEMDIAGGEKSETVLSMMWQLRHISSSCSHIGFVFSGSNLARKYFVGNSDAAFYNGIPTLELTPFNVKTPESKQHARDIVMPQRMQTSYSLPDQTLSHLLWITAGIPYYMKLVAGATFCVARQSYLVPTDVNAGLQAIFSKNTGIARLDSLDNPGEDELRTLYASTEEARLLARSVLYSIAEIRSPLDGRGVRIGEIKAETSPLRARYAMSREKIDIGLGICLDLGYIRHSEKNEGEVEFTIPVLGESIRSRKGTLWATIHDKLEDMARGENAST